MRGGMNRVMFHLGNVRAGLANARTVEKLQEAFVELGAPIPVDVLKAVEREGGTVKQYNALRKKLGHALLKAKRQEEAKTLQAEEAAA